MSRGVCGQCGELYSDDFPCECMTPSPSPERMSEEDFGKWGLVTCYSTLFTEARRARENEIAYAEDYYAVRAERDAKDAEIAALKSRAERLREALRRIRRRGGNYADMKEIAHAALAEEREEGK